jgi:TIR domain
LETTVLLFVLRSTLSYDTRESNHIGQLFLKRIGSHKLRIFLCHSSDDKPIVREVYKKLRNDSFEPWLDEENLLAGQNWQQEIPKAVRNSDVILVCLSRNSVTKSGYVQKEIRLALDVADEQPEGTIFLIPLRLEECEFPEQLKRWHWVNVYEEGGYERLRKALQFRAATLNGELQPSSSSTVYPPSTSGEFSKSLASHQPFERELKTYQWISPQTSQIVLGCLLVLLLLTIFLRSRPDTSPTLSIAVQADGIQIENTTDYPIENLRAYYARYKFDKARHSMIERLVVDVSDLISDKINDERMLAPRQISRILTEKLLARSDSTQNGVPTNSDKIIIRALVIYFSGKTKPVIAPFSVIQDIQGQSLLYPLREGGNSESVGIKPDELNEMLKKIEEL